MAQQQIVLVAPAAAALAHELLLKGGRVESDRPFQQRIQVFKRNRFGVAGMDACKRFQRRGERPRVADARKISVQIDRGVRERGVQGRFSLRLAVTRRE
jgi:hypothetical protein